MSKTLENVYSDRHQKYIAIENNMASVAATSLKDLAPAAVNFSFYSLIALYGSKLTGYHITLLSIVEHYHTKAPHGGH